MSWKLNMHLCKDREYQYMCTIFIDCLPASTVLGSGEIKCMMIPIYKKKKMQKKYDMFFKHCYNRSHHILFSFMMLVLNTLNYLFKYTEH